MDLSCRRTALRQSVLLCVAATGLGCASPGPPRAPSLHIPEPVTDLTALRTGDSVELRFTPATRSTDKLPLPPTPVTFTVCREMEHQACIAVPALSGQPVASAATSSAAPATIEVHDQLPPELTAGTARWLAYRVQLFSTAGRTAGYSDAAYTAAGPAPPTVEGLTAQGSRLGIVLQWSPAPATEGEVLLRRQDLSKDAEARTQAHEAPATPKADAHKTHAAEAARDSRTASSRRSAGSDSSVVWLIAEKTPGSASDQDPAPGMIDPSARVDVPYEYRAIRRRFVALGGRRIELHSADSRRTDCILREIYPPAVPTGLLAAGFSTGAANAAGQAEKYGVDLIWQPVDDAKLAGYNVYRQELDDRGNPAGVREKLNSSLIALPGFRDTTAKAGTQYVYGVSAVDEKGNESASATTLLQR